MNSCFFRTNVHVVLGPERLKVHSCAHRAADGAFLLPAEVVVMLWAVWLCGLTCLQDQNRAEVGQ